MPAFIGFLVVFQLAGILTCLGIDVLAAELGPRVVPNWRQQTAWLRNQPVATTPLGAKLSSVIGAGPFQIRPTLFD